MKLQKEHASSKKKKRKENRSAIIDRVINISFSLAESKNRHKIMYLQNILRTLLSNSGKIQTYFAKGQKSNLNVYPLARKNKKPLMWLPKQKLPKNLVNKNLEQMS